MLTRLGHAQDGRASPPERRASGAGTMKTKSVINHLRSIGRSEQADQLSEALLRRYAETKRGQGMKEEDIARRLRAIEEMVRPRDEHRGSCVDFTDALMSFTSTSGASGPPPRPARRLNQPIALQGPSKPLGPKRQVSYPSPTSPLATRFYTPQKSTTGDTFSPPSPAPSNLITPPTPRIGLPLPVIIPPTPPTPTRPRRRRLKASISSIETVTSPQARGPIPALSLPRLPSLIKSEGFDFNLDLFSPRPPAPCPSDPFFASASATASAPLVEPLATTRAGTRGSLVLPDGQAEGWDEADADLLDAFPLPPPRLHGYGVPLESEPQTQQSAYISPRSQFSQPSDKNPRNPRDPFPETPETIRPAPRNHQPTRTLPLEDLWWDDESDAQTVTAATPSTERSSFLSDWSAPSGDPHGQRVSILTCPSAASLIRDEYLKARIKDSRCSIESFSQGDPFIQATLSAMRSNGRV